MNNYSYVASALQTTVASAEAYHNESTYSGNFAGEPSEFVLTTGPTGNGSDVCVRPSPVLHNPSIEHLVAMCKVA